MQLATLASLTLIPLFAACSWQTRSPGTFRSGIFFHHSTGKCIWGPNGSSTSVGKEISRYNARHGLTGENSVDLDKKWWPDPDNEWATWHQIFENRNPDYDIRPYLQKNAIVVIKSCFPSSNIGDLGSPADTASPGTKTVYNFKWHWRSIVGVMRRHPQNFFVIWTNAPQAASQTTEAEAALASAACRWAKDTLAAGLDSEFGEFPDNVYVFDFFHKLADANGTLPLRYSVSATDPHPNAAATEIVAPQFVDEVFKASIAYEGRLRSKTPRERSSSE